jgi:hypothetical protein
MMDRRAWASKFSWIELFFLFKKLFSIPRLFGTVFLKYFLFENILK